MKLLHNKGGYIILAEISLGIYSALNSRYLLGRKFFFFFLPAVKPVAALPLGWEITVKLQQEGFGLLNILKLRECLAAINAGIKKTTLFPAIKFVQLPPRQQTQL